MKWTIKLVVEVVPGSPVEHEVGSIERAEEVSPATVGTIAEGNAKRADANQDSNRFAARIYMRPPWVCDGSMRLSLILKTNFYLRRNIRPSWSL